MIFLAWGLLDFGTGYSAHDTTQQSQAIKKGDRWSDHDCSSGNFETTGRFVMKTWNPERR